MTTGLIYKVTCTSNNKFIIGSTINFKRRVREYNSKLERNIFNNPVLQNCYNKYGKESIKFEIIQENIPENILNFVEDIWIGASCGRVDDKKNGMNIRDASRIRFTKEYYAELGLKRKGFKFSEESKEKMRLNSGRIGKKFPHSEETKQKLREKILEYHRTHVHPSLGKKRIKK